MNNNNNNNNNNYNNNDKNSITTTSFLIMIFPTGFVLVLINFHDGIDDEMPSVNIVKYHLKF